MKEVEEVSSVFWEFFKVLPKREKIKSESHLDRFTSAQLENVTYFIDHT